MGKYKGVNLATASSAAKILNESVSDRFCFFISHRRNDKQDAKRVSDYINNSGFNTYLDVNDDKLQNAVDAHDSEKITECIQDGIKASTHIICLVSEKTRLSWWVPFEIGYAKSSSLVVLTLKLKGNYELPEYLEISKIILGTKSLNMYLESMLNRNRIYEVYSSSDRYLTKYTETHPLDDTLDFDK